MSDQAKRVAEACDRLSHDFDEDEPSPLFDPERDDRIRDDVLTLIEASKLRPADREDTRPVVIEYGDGSEAVLAAVAQLLCIIEEMRPVTVRLVPHLSGRPDNPPIN